MYRAIAFMTCMMLLMFFFKSKAAAQQKSIGTITMVKNK
jgi:hypothetical protein